MTTNFACLWEHQAPRPVTGSRSPTILVCSRDSPQRRWGRKSEEGRGWSSQGSAWLSARARAACLTEVLGHEATSQSVRLMRQGRPPSRLVAGVSQFHFRAKLCPPWLARSEVTDAHDRLRPEVAAGRARPGKSSAPWPRTPAAPQASGPESWLCRCPRRSLGEEPVRQGLV